MNKKLKINFLVYNPDLGGGDRVTAMHAGYLKKKGHDVTVSALKAKPASLFYRIKRYLRTGNFGKSSFTTAYFDRVGVPLNVIENKNRIDEADVPDSDILIATYWLTAEWAMTMPLAKGAKAYFIQGYESLFPFSHTERVNATYRAPFGKIVISSWLDGVMRRDFDTPPIAKVPNSVDMIQFHADPRGKHAPPCVGFLYGDSDNKGVDVTLKAIEKMQAEIPELKVMTFGASHVTETLPLPQNCEYHYKPDQEKIRDLYAKCDVWMSGSRMEGFNLTILEAMACRTPVVATKAGAAPDLIESGAQGYVVSLEDSNALAEKALHILNLTEPEWQRMSDAAYETATRYTWDDAGALFEAALYEIARADGRI
jgi:glycosyltransferase involved in cell wall biosynthesis